MEWMLLPLKRYADFNGRSRRKEYWMFQLLMAIVMAVLYVFVFAGLATGTPDSPGVLAWIGLLLMVVVGLATFVPALAVLVRRFHDQDKSGWFALLAFIPFVGGIIVLVFMCLPGTPGPNQFGEDPLSN